MESKEILALVPTVVGSLKTIKETCDSLNVGFLPPNLQKLQNLKQQVKELEERVQLGFPKLASLTKVYAEVSADVRVAKAVSDKNHELLGFLEEVKSVKDFLGRIPGEMENDCTRIEKRLEDLPMSMTVELGKIKIHLDNIRMEIIILKQSNLSANALKEEITQSQIRARDITGKIATYYSKLDAVLSGLLNRILENIGQAKL